MIVSLAGWGVRAGFMEKFWERLGWPGLTEVCEALGHGWTSHGAGPKARDIWSRGEP